MDPNMTYDHENIFTTDNDILVEVSQFISCVSNKILSQNINFQRDLGITSLDSFNALLTQELDEYKVYDC
jgi:hypothetical protein